MESLSLEGKNAIVTGASRGIGAEIAYLLAIRGAVVLGTYLSKERRMMQVCMRAKAKMGVIVPLAADITESEGRVRIFQHATGQFKTVDFLILNAAGGLERERLNDPQWPMHINKEAQLALVELLLPLLRPSGKIVYLTSVWAHRLGEVAQFPGYEGVARSKHACEEALRELIPTLNRHGIVVGFVCGHLVEGTATKTLFERLDPTLMAKVAATAQGGKLPTTCDIAHAVVELISREFPSGETIFVGGKDAPIVALRPAIWDRAYIEGITPFGPEAIYLDTFAPMDAGRRGIATLQVTDVYCKGHFKDSAFRVMPVHLILEAANQAAYLLGLSREATGERIPLFKRAEGIQCFAPAFPGMQLTFEVRESEQGRVDCVVSFEGREVARIDKIEGPLLPMRIAQRILRRVGAV